MLKTVFSPKTSPYTLRLATPEDIKPLASLTAAFHRERVAIDPTRTLKPDFDFEEYTRDRLSQPLHYYWVLENCNSPEQKTIVGFLFVSGRDEAPPEDAAIALAQTHNRLIPYQPRRVGTALALYLLPKHRNPQTIKLLIEAGIQQAREWKISDLDIQVGADKTGLQKLLKRLGFQQTSVQYTLHFDLPQDAELPSLHPSSLQRETLDFPQPDRLPLRDLNTQQIVCDPQGETIFLTPLKNEEGELLKTSKGLPIYPTPVCHPQTRNYLFDEGGKLVVSPVLRDDNGEIIEQNGIPIFHPPAYQFVKGQLQLYKSSTGEYIFCDVERDKTGNILRDRSGQPIFKQPLPQPTSC
ncbi:MAG: hypothetical protein AAGA60_16440 [Cyanobacteria bacterium P01_E01_bin.42]